MCASKAAVDFRVKLCMIFSRNLFSIRGFYKWFYADVVLNVSYMGMAMIAPTHVDPRFCDIACNLIKTLP